MKTRVCLGEKLRLLTQNSSQCDAIRAHFRARARARARARSGAEAGAGAQITRLV
jgi:hypothetical protein